MNRISTIIIATIFAFFLFSCHQGTSENKSSGGSVLQDTVKTGKSKPTGLPENPSNPKIDPEVEKKSSEAARLYGESIKALQQGDNEKGLEYMTQSINLYPTPPNLQKRGFLYITMKRYPEAVADLTKVLEMDSTVASTFYGRGLAYYMMNEIDLAEKDLSNYVSKEGGNVQAWNYYGAIKFMKKDYKTALDCYDKVIKLKPNFPDAYSNRGMMHHNLGELDLAIADYNEALKIKPDNINALNNRGAAYMTQEKYQEAFNDFDEAIKMKPSYPEAYDNRGKARLKLGDKTGACEDWQKAYSLGITSARESISKYCGK
jgi:tetratricopeptide (TPR) repeat protein